MDLRSKLTAILPLVILSWAGFAAQVTTGESTPEQQTASSAGQATPSTAAAAKNTSPPEELTGLPRGKKLVLTDGSFQLVRSYEKSGDRVRYYSVERDDWEMIPASMVDWDATKKAEAAQEKAAETLVAKVKIQEDASRAEAPIDVDESLMVARGVFLPDGEGMFAYEGKSIKKLSQVGSQERTDKKTVLKQIFTPVPIIASKHNIEIPGPKATVRLTSSGPEFYLREPTSDPTHDSTVLRSSRQNEDGPDVILVRVKVKGNKRMLESIRSMFGQQLSEERDDIAVQRWEVAKDVYRFTLSAPLPPGEYVLAEILQDSLNMYVWDFGVDAAPTPAPTTH